MRSLNRDTWPYLVKIQNYDPRERTELDDWCTEMFGRKHRDWYAYTLEPGRRTYAFKTEADLLIFKLRCNTTCSK